MEYYEKLLNESLYGNDDALADLKFEAGAGNTEAQYYLALFYERTGGKHDPDYLYWIDKYQDSLKRDERLYQMYGYPTPTVDFHELFDNFNIVHGIFSIVSFML